MRRSSTASRRNARPDGAPDKSRFDLAPYVSEIRDEIRSLCSLQFQEAGTGHLRSMRFIKSDFVDFLGLFHLNEKYISVEALPSGEIDIRIQGPWLHTILFEIPVLAIVNEVYFRNTQVPDLVGGRGGWTPRWRRLRRTGPGPDLKIADYGTAAGASARPGMVKVLASVRSERPSDLDMAGPGQMAGTSNVLLMMRLGLTPWAPWRTSTRRPARGPGA